MSEWLPGTWVPKGPPVVNTFTNPGFEAGAGTVEVRRNLNPTPNWSAGFTGWAVSGLTDGGAVPGGRTFTGNGTLPNINRMSGSSITVPPASPYMQGWMVKVAPTSPAVTFINRSIIGATNVRKTGVTVQPGATAYVAHVFDAPSGTIRPALEVSNPGGAAFEFTVLDGVNVESAPVVRPAFSGAHSPDVDFTASWTGAVNGSPSILTGVQAAGVTMVGGVGILSSRWAKHGARSLRVITTGGSGSYAVIPAPAGQCTAMVTAHLEAPLPAMVSIFPSLTNGTQTAPVPNAAGDYELRVVGGRSESVSGFLLTGGITVGDSVWYDRAGVFAGTYDGPWFDGSTPDTDQWIHAWTGPVNGSTSTRQEMEAVMATIYGTLTDFGLQTLAPYKPVLKFTPSGPGVKGRKVFSGRPVEAPVASSGAFAVLLEPTDGVTPEVWYTVSIEYLNDGGQYTSLDILGYRLFVPAPGGAIGDLPGAPLSADTVLVGLNPPPPGYRGWWLYSPAEGEEMPADETGIGDLRMVA